MVYDSISNIDIEYYIKDNKNCIGWPYRGYESIKIFRDHMKLSQTIDTKKLIHSLVIYRDNHSILTAESLDVINKILGDTKILKKCVIIRNASFCVNRVRVNYDFRKNKISFEPELCLYYFHTAKLNEKEIYERFKKLSVKEKMNWIYNHFETIYIQLNLIDSDKDIYSSMFHFKWNS